MSNNYGSTGKKRPAKCDAYLKREADQDMTRIFDGNLFTGGSENASSSG